mmetsp:Transcript_16195/g.18203  ORF Transcript_16195/g.18203 Transcript_16195/m.18203 type:complete len:137 (+) Transcript_16195:1001-1411(+)
MMPRLRLSGTTVEKVEMRLLPAPWFAQCQMVSNLDVALDYQMLIAAIHQRLDQRSLSDISKLLREDILDSRPSSADMKPFKRFFWKCFLFFLSRPSGVYFFFDLPFFHFLMPILKTSDFCKFLSGKKVFVLYQDAT